MKSIMLYANDDAGFEARLQAALAVVRAFGGRLACLHVTPYDSFIMGDPFGGIYALPVVVEQLGRVEAEQRARVEERLGREGIDWEWLQVDGPAAHVIADRSRLADLVVLSLPAGEGPGHPSRLSLAADVAVHVRGPVLAIPPAGSAIDIGGIALVAWNGSPEAAHALRLSLPMLGRAAAIHLVTVAEQAPRFPAAEAAAYLALHGLAATTREVPAGAGGAGEALIAAAGTLGAAYVAMGAYGHGRLREAVLGGTTRHMLEQAEIPLLLAH